MQRLLAFVPDQKILMPGCALHPGSIQISFPPGPAANTIPSDMPNFIFLGLRLAIMTVSWAFQGLPADRRIDTCKHIAGSAPDVEGEPKQWIRPSTCSAFGIRATRRSTFAKSSNSISGAIGSVAGFASALPLWRDSGFRYARVFHHCFNLFGVYLSSSSA